MEPDRDELREFEAVVRRKDVAAVRRLLERSRNVRDHINDPRFDFGQRATHVAANTPELIDLLLDFGADVSLRSDWPQGPYSVLDNADEVNARRLMARGAALTANVASRLGWFDELRALVESNAEAVHERGGDGQQPLHQAKTVEIADYLLDRGAGIDVPCIDHKSTPAQYALAGRPDVCRRLLDRGARPDIFMAAFLGDLLLADRLISEEPSCLAARINQPGYGAVPPFNIYCWTLGFLLSPHEVARAQGHGELHQRMVERSPLRVRYMDAAFSGNEAGARAALAEDPSLHATLTRHEHGQLALAIFNERLSAARLMLDLGFDPAAPGTDGGSALHAACWIGSVELVSRILDTGRIPVDLRDPTHGSTPLGWTAFGSVHRHSEHGDYPAVIDRLVGAGADVQAAGNRPGHSLLQMAAGNDPVEAVLRRHGAA